MPINAISRTVTFPDVIGTGCASTAVVDFYDRALCAALQGLLAAPDLGEGDIDFARQSMRHARLLTEARFGVTLALPWERG